MKNIIAELEAYLETEMNYLKVGLDKETDPIQRSNIAWYCVQRCLGAAQFANSCGGDYGTIEALFEGIKIKIAEMEKGA